MARGDQIGKLRNKAWSKVDREHERSFECLLKSDQNESYSYLSQLHYNGITENRVSITRDEYHVGGGKTTFSVGDTFLSVVRRVQGNLPWIANFADAQALSDMAKLPRKSKPKAPTAS